MKQLQHPKQSISPSTTKINAGGITQVIAARPRKRTIRWQFVRDTMTLRHPFVHHYQLRIVCARLCVCTVAALILTLVRSGRSVLPSFALSVFCCL